MYSRMRILSFFASVFYVTTLTSAMHTAYMDQYCGRTKDIGGTAAIRIKLTADSSHRPNMDCIFTVKGEHSNEDRLMIQFIDLDIQCTCDGDGLSLYEGFMSSNSTIAPYGGWFRYTTELEISLNNNEFNMHITYFEDLKTNGVEEIKKIAEFLKLGVDEEVCHAINEECVFEKMVVEKAYPKQISFKIFRRDFSLFRKAYMDQYCGRTKDIGGTAAIRIKLTADSSYRPNIDCIFTVKGEHSNEDRLMIQFISPRKFCGWPKPSYIYTTIRSELTFYFHSDDSSPDQGFTIILTHFQSGKCDGTSETKCDNGRCIASTLACNGFNPCGDHSDCPLGTGGIAGIVAGSVAFVIICIGVVAAVRGRLYLFRRRGVAMTTASTTAVSMPSSQSYILSAPQQLSSVPTVPIMYPGQNLGQNIGHYVRQSMGQNTGQIMVQNIGHHITTYTPPSKY